MLAEPSLYSRFIFICKILLGLASFSIFIAIFFFSSSVNMRENVTVLSKDVKIGAKYQAYKTKIKGVTSDGSSFDFNSESLDPSKTDGDIVVISEPEGLVYLPNREKMNFSSRFATFHIVNKQLSFKGQVELTDSQGNFIQTQELTADFKEKMLRSENSVKVKTSIGLIKSGGLKYFYGSNIKNNNNNIVFYNGVNIEFSK